jgi:hypothetical protein
VLSRRREDEGSEQVQNMALWVQSGMWDLTRVDVSAMAMFGYAMDNAKNTHVNTS